MWRQFHLVGWSTSSLPPLLLLTVLVWLGAFVAGSKRFARPVSLALGLGVIVPVVAERWPGELGRVHHTPLPRPHKVHGAAMGSCQHIPGHRKHMICRYKASVPFIEKCAPTVPLDAAVPLLVPQQHHPGKLPQVCGLSTSNIQNYRLYI